MRYPIISVQLWDNLGEKVYEHRESLGWIEQFPLVYLLYVKISINRNLNYDED